MNKIIILIATLLMTGCDVGSILCSSCDVTTLQGELPQEDDDRVLNVYWDYSTLDENGYYHYPYQGHNYGTIYFEISNVETHTLVGWTSPQEYCVDHYGTEICEPVINYQTYSDEYGDGQQSFYMNETFVGDTLFLVGYLNENVADAIYVIIK
jgi:hypothetical protein